MSASNPDPYANNPELEHAATVAMTAVPVHRPDAPTPPAAPEGGGRGRWIALIALAVLLIGGGVTAALLLTGGDDDEGTASAEASQSAEDSDPSEPAATPAASRPDETPRESPEVEAAEAPAASVVPEATGSPAAPVDLPAIPEGPTVPAREALLVPAATPEELAAAAALGERLAGLDGDSRARRELFGEPEALRSLVVLAATTDDAMMAERALVGAREASRMTPADEDGDFVRVALFWTRVDGGTDWRTLEPALELLRTVPVERRAASDITRRLAELLRFDADPAVQHAALALVSSRMMRSSPTLCDAIEGLLASPRPLLVHLALRAFAAAPDEARIASLAGAARRLLTTHDDPGVRGAALRLGAALTGSHQLSSEEVLPWLGDWHPYVQAEAIGALVALGEPAAIHAVAPLIERKCDATLSYAALRKGESRVRVSAGGWSRRLDVVASEGIATLSASLDHRLSLRDQHQTFGNSAVAVARARTWYAAHRDTLAKLASFAPVHNAPPEERVEAGQLDLSPYRVELEVGALVLAPTHLWETPNHGVHFAATNGVVLVAGEHASLVKVDDAASWMPNALLVPVRPGTRPQPQVGELVLSADPQIFGSGLFLVTGTSEAGRPLARPHATPLDIKPVELEPGFYRVVTEPGGPGSFVSVAEADDAFGARLAMVLRVSDSHLLVRGFAGDVRSVPRASATPLPLRAPVAVGDTAWVPDKVSRFVATEVTSVDAETGIITVAAAKGARTIDASSEHDPGTYSASEPPGVATW